MHAAVIGSSAKDDGAGMGKGRWVKAADDGLGKCWG